MVTLPNIYTSDLRTILNWSEKLSTIPEEVESVLLRLKKDLHDIQTGKG